jgi:hypothetical protein
MTANETMGSSPSSSATSSSPIALIIGGFSAMHSRELRRIWRPYPIIDK